MTTGEYVITENARHSVALSTIDEGTFVIGFDGTIVEANDALLRLLNVSKSECVGRLFEYFIDHAERPRFRENLRLLLSKEPIRYETKALRGDRVPFLAEVKAYLLRDESKKPYGIVGMIKDITARVEIQERIARTTRELTALLKSSTEIIRTTDFHKRLKAIAQAIQGLGWRRVLITLTDENLETTDIVSAGLTPEEEEYLWKNKQPGHVWRKRLGPTFDHFKLGEFYYLPWSDPFVRNHFKVGTVGSKVPKEEMVDWDPQDLLYAPLRLPEGHVVGRISIDDPLDGRRPTRESLAPLELFVHQAAVAIENAYLIRDLEVARNQLKEYADQLEQKVEERTSALKKSEEKLRSIFTASPNPIMLIDLNGRIIECNQATLDMHGYSSREELVGKNGLELAAKRDRQRATEYLQKTFELGSIKNIEYVCLTKDRVEFPVEVSASVVRDALGNPTSFVAITQNIAERKKTEEALRESEERYRSVVNNIGIGVSLISPKMEILTLNDQMKEWFPGINVSNKPVCYQVFYEPPRDKECVYCPICKTLKDGRVHESTTDGATDSGRDYRIVSSPIKDKDGKIIAVIELVEDITERRRMESQLLKSERLAAIGELATMVGHDLRNPLTGIGGAAYYLKMKLSSKMDKKTSEMLELIEKDIQYSNKIINDLLDFSRDIRLARARVSIKSLIEETITKMKIPKNVRIANLTEKTLEVSVDANQMRRVFFNIIKNAVDAMPRGGELEIRSEKVSDLLKIVFRDTGVGISKENLNRLGSPLFTTKAKGVGMGLAICKRLTEAHGGLLSIESKEKAGTCVTITLPIDEKQKPEEEGARR